jgi:hypothetical protein
MVGHPSIRREDSRFREEFTGGFGIRHEAFTSAS